MRRAKIAAALLPALTLLLPRAAVAGVAALDTVSSCPSVIKNVITLETLLSDGFAPWDAVEVVDTVDTVNAVDITDNMTGAVDTVNVIDTAGALDTINTVNVIDTVDTVNTTNTAVANVNINTDDNDRDVRRKPSWIKRNMKFGRRAAFNQSEVTDVLIRIYRHDGESFSYEEYKNRASFGIGFEVAGVIDLVLSDALALNFSPGVAFRKPINTAVVGTSEVGVSFPFLLEWGPFSALGRRGAAPADVFEKPWAGGFNNLRRLRLFGGIWVGAPIFAWVNWNDEESARFKERAAAEIGLIGGIGVYVSDRAFIDVRGILGLSGYDSVEGHRLNQLAIGVNYVK